MAGFDGWLGARSDYPDGVYDGLAAQQVQQRLWQCVQTDQQFGWPAAQQGLYQGEYSHRAGIGLRPPHRPAPPSMEQPVQMLPGQYNGPTKMYHGQLYGLDQYGGWFPVEQVPPLQEVPGEPEEGYPPGPPQTWPGQPYIMNRSDYRFPVQPAAPQWQEPQIDLPSLEAGIPATENMRAPYPINSREAQVYRQSRNAVVEIEASNRLVNGRVEIGSGFFVRSDGELATDFHIISESNPKDIQVITADGKKYVAAVECVDKANDLALLKVEANSKDQFTALPLGSSRLIPGEGLMTLGHPNGWTDIYASPGSFLKVIPLSFMRASNEPTSVAQNSDRTLLLSNMHTEPGDCGAPVLNSAGQVVGLHNRGSQLRFAGATPVERLEQMLDWLHQRQFVQNNPFEVRPQN